MHSNVDASSEASTVSSLAAAPQRIEFLDFMRGFAVTVMVFGHSIDAMLSDAVRQTEFFGTYNFLRGFTAPLFLLVSGFTFMVATSKRWNDYRSFTKPLRKRLNKMSLLLLIGYALHFPFFSLYMLLYKTSPEGYEQMFQVDVLHCFAVSILLLHVLVYISPTPKQFLIKLAVVTLIIVFSTPLVWGIDFGQLISPVVGPYFNQIQPSLFPLFPYTAFMYCGIFAGYFYLQSRKEKWELKYFRWLALAGIGAIFLGVLSSQILFSMYPPHDWWKAHPDFFLIRLGVVLCVTASFFYARLLPKIVRTQLAVLGGSSLMVYTIHLAIVYGSAASHGLAQRIGQVLNFGEALAVAFSVILLMLAIVYGWRYLSTHHQTSSRLVQYAFAITLLFVFITKPY